MKYPTIQNKEWVQPIRKGYKLCCCDCGLVHTVNFRLVNNQTGLGKSIHMQFERNIRATGQVRRWMKANGGGGE